MSRTGVALIVLFYGTLMGGVSGAQPASSDGLELPDPAAAAQAYSLLDDLAEARASGDTDLEVAILRELYALTGWQDFALGEANALVNAGRCTEALPVLRTLTSSPEPEVAATARNRIESLPAELQIQTSPTEAALVLDGVVMGTVPAEGWQAVVAPGAHIVRIEGTGTATMTRTVDLGPCELAQLVFAIPPTTHALVSREVPASISRRRIGWGLLAAGGALGVGALTYDIASAPLLDERDAAAVAGDADRHARLQREVEQAQVVDAALWGSATLLVATGVVLILTSGGSEDPSGYDLMAGPNGTGGWSLGVRGRY